MSAPAHLPVPFPHALGVVGRGGVVFEEGDRRRVYPLASVTKVLSARAVQVALDRHLLGLDDPVGPPGSTVRHLLAHASGLAPDGDRVLAKPGRRRIYSNRGFEVLGAAFERRVGTSFARWVDESLCAPLGLVDTEVAGSPARSGVASLADLEAVAGELLAPRLVSPDLDRRATAVAFPGLPGVLPGYGRFEDNAWGLGFEIRARKSPHWTATDAGPWVFGHFGQSGCFLWVDRRRGLAGVFLGEAPFGAWHRRHWARLNAELSGAAR